MLKDILDVTYGTIVYQEQVMQLLRELAGYSLGAADMVRRKKKKKQADVLEQQFVAVPLANVFRLKKTFHIVPYF